MGRGADGDLHVRRMQEAEDLQEGGSTLAMALGAAWTRREAYSGYSQLPLEPEFLSGGCAAGLGM